MQILFSERLSELMDEREIASEQLAEKVGVIPDAVRRWKRGAASIMLKHLINVCDTLNCSLDFIAGRTETILDFTPKPCPPFYPRLRQVMQQQNISRNSIVKKAGIRDYSFIVWKRGGEPKLETLIQLADYIGCTLDYLVGRE